MDDKPDGKRSRWRLWTGIVVFPLLVLYVFCIGPAFRVIERVRCGASSIDHWSRLRAFRPLET